MIYLERRHRIEVSGPIDRVFPLFTPLGEMLWVEGWAPEFLHPADGAIGEGMVFRTRHGGEETLWSCTIWDPDGHRVRYVRVTPTSRFGFVEVACRALSPDTTEAVVSYTFTALTPDGQADLDGLSEDGYRHMIETWRRQIDAWLHRPARPEALPPIIQPN